MAMKIYEGQRVGLLEILCCVGSSSGGDKLWATLCDCGIAKIRTATSIRRKVTVKSCGCGRPGPKIKSTERYQHLPDALYKVGRNWRARIDCRDMSISEWRQQPGVNAPLRTINNRIYDYNCGRWNHGVKEIFFDPPKRKHKKVIVKLKNIPMKTPIYDEQAQDDRARVQAVMSSWGIRAHIDRRKWAKMSRM